MSESSSELRLRTFLANEYADLWRTAGAPLSFPATILSGTAHTAPSPRKDTPSKPKKPVPPPVMTAPTQALNIETHEGLRAHIGDCKRCKLCTTRNKIVYADGSPKARLMFVGEGPGADEDRTGVPFVGRAGQLLTKIIEAMGLQRQDVYIANIVKCRPPENRQPEPDEIAACTPFLRTQIELVNPDVIVALGATSAKYLVGREAPMSALRGGFHPIAGAEKREFLATYHPAYLLRNPPAKKFVWDDMKIVMKRLGMPEKGLTQ